MHKLHATAIGEILTAVGYEPAFIVRVQNIVQKHNLRGDSDVQTLEDALCLVFLQTQLGDLRRNHGDEKVLEILLKTLKKMSDAAKEFALELELSESDRTLLEQAARA